MLESNHKDLALQVIQRIQFAVRVMLIACVFLIVAIVWRAFIDPCKKPDQLDQNTQYIWFTTFVHGCEGVVSWALLYTLKNRKKPVERRKSVEISSSTAAAETETSTNAYVAAEESNV